MTTSFEPLKNIWQNGSNFVNLGFVIGLIFVFTLAHYFLLTLVLDFDDKTTSAAFVMGIFNAPWYLLSPLTFFIPLVFLIVAYLVGRKTKAQ